VRLVKNLTLLWNWELGTLNSNFISQSLSFPREQKAKAGICSKFCIQLLDLKGFLERECASHVVRIFVATEVVVLAEQNALNTPLFKCCATIFIPLK